MNILKSKLKTVLGAEEKEIKGLRLVSKGYLANSFYLKTGRGDFFIKEFNDAGIADGEIQAIKLLGEIKVEKVITPKIIFSDEHIIIMQYERGIKFYDYLKSEIKNGEKANIFFEFGKYIALLHNKNFQRSSKDGIPLAKIHGDLNSKNFLIVGGKIFITDPIGKIGSIYNDLAEFVLNFYPVNILLEAALREKELFIRSFLDGYANNSRLELKNERLNDSIVKVLISGKKYLSDDFKYRLKKFFINIYANRLINSFQNGKIQIKLYE